MVLVIGGSSGTGLACVQLLHRHNVRTRVLTRDPSRAARQLPPGVDVIQGDMTAQGTYVRATEYDGVLNVLAAARASGFRGRFMYMTASGVRSRAIAARGLNLWTWRPSLLRRFNTRPHPVPPSR
jgi:uncharacterized protein YbjT (DUF2867 family)